MLLRNLLNMLPRFAMHARCHCNEYTCGSHFSGARRRELDGKKKFEKNMPSKRKAMYSVADRLSNDIYSNELFDSVNMKDYDKASSVVRDRKCT